ncbi:adenylosuccinate lyase [Aureivirga marina]|uniref:adenylosuccinate lyase n=1 Tax=Aureivirga marina TaxID=1182451 RepID=UPI0018CA5F87|nr:adenylosuccinate lyase [Aureivirga marina]
MKSEKEILKAILDKVINPKREYRNQAAEEIMSQPKLFSSLISLVYENHKKYSKKAAWSLEWISKERLDFVYENIDLFLEKIQEPKEDSIVRPLAKVCELLAFDYYKKKGKTELKEEQIEKIVEACFDWLISDRKVAVEAYSMQTLFIFRKKADWIEEELVNILEKNMPTGSAGYKARGRRILEQIEIEKELQ